MTREFTELTTRDVVRAYIQSNLVGLRDDEGFEDDDDLFKRGLVNSLFAMQLVAFVEEEFGLTVENSELVIDNFNTVNHICDLIARRRPA